MTKPTLTLHTLQYTKADLDKAPESDRLFFLMATSLANDVQMLNKTMLLIIDNGEADEHRIAQQANNAYAMMILRMLAGRLVEGWKVLSRFSGTLRADYEPLMREEERQALTKLRAYFNAKGKEPNAEGKRRSFLWELRDQVAFHSLRPTVEAAYASLPETEELGDYMHDRTGNTFYYTTELLHYEAIMNLAGTRDFEAAVEMLFDDTIDQTGHFITAIYGFAMVFCKRYLLRAMHKMLDDSETFSVDRFADLKLPYFMDLPQRLPEG